jgi:hypothetical protein
LCRRCQKLEGLPEPDSSVLQEAQRGESGGRKLCARCGTAVTEEDQKAILSEMLERFGLLGEPGTVLERRARGALERPRKR